MQEQQIFRPSKENTGYAYAVGRIRAMETRLLNGTDITRLLEADSAAEVIKILSEGEYEKTMSGISDIMDFETALNQEREYVYNLIDELSLDPQLSQIFRIKWDFHNLKVLLKSNYQDGSVSQDALVESGTIPIEDLKQKIQPDEEAGNVNLPQYINDALDEAKESYEEDQNPQVIDIVIDRHMHSFMYKSAEDADNNFMTGYLKAIADLTNIKSFIRIKSLDETMRLLDAVLLPHGSLDKQFYIKQFDETVDNFAASLSNTPYAQVVAEGLRSWPEDKSLAVYERLSDEYFMDFIRKAKYMVFGVEPIIGYLLAKEHEMKLIRIIVIGKLNDLPSDAIKERLRKTYV
ncbi:V-type ATP synthase subunit C [Candidatus Poribacteria bacterium]|nr:V-type ATP synthase subunit C [Candidatus Poribacteria bacterium]